MVKLSTRAVRTAHKEELLKEYAIIMGKLPKTFNPTLLYIMYNRLTELDDQLKTGDYEQRTL